VTEEQIDESEVRMKKISDNLIVSDLLFDALVEINREEFTKEITDREEFAEYVKGDIERVGYVLNTEELSGTIDSSVTDDLSGVMVNAKTAALMLDFSTDPRYYVELSNNAEALKKLLDNEDICRIISGDLTALNILSSNKTSADILIENDDLIGTIATTNAAAFSNKTLLERIANNSTAMDIVVSNSDVLDIILDSKYASVITTSDYFNPKLISDKWRIFRIGRHITLKWNYSSTIYSDTTYNIVFDVCQNCLAKPTNSSNANYVKAITLISQNCIIDPMRWTEGVKTSSYSTTYAADYYNSDIRSWLNGDCLNGFTEKVRNSMLYTGLTSYYYNGTAGSSTSFNDRIWMPSLSELGIYSGSGYQTDGTSGKSKHEYVDIDSKSINIAGGFVTNMWTRSCYMSSSNSPMDEAYAISFDRFTDYNKNYLNNKSCSQEYSFPIVFSL
jgi:hypothetical protein